MQLHDDKNENIYFQKAQNYYFRKTEIVSFSTTKFKMLKNLHLLKNDEQEEYFTKI